MKGLSLKSDYIVFYKVTKNFKVGKNVQEILRDASFVLPEKGLIAIYGKSGTGKTTILNLISAIESVDSGNVVVNGLRVSSASESVRTKYRRDSISYVFQNNNLIEDMTVFENIDIYLSIKSVSISKNEILTKLNEFNLGHILDQRVSTLSGGERQRVCIISAILAKTEVILFDEPTGALDTVNSRLVMDDIKRLATISLVVMVSHNHELIKEYANIVYELKNQTLRLEKCNAQSAVFKPLSYIEKASNKWMIRLLKRFTWKNILSNLVTIFVTSFSLTALLFGLAFTLSTDEIENQSLLKRPDYMMIDLIKKENQESRGSIITLTKSMRPEISDLEDILLDFPGAQVECDLGGIISPIQNFYYGDTFYEAINFKPFYDIESWNERRVIINGSFAKMIGFDSDRPYLSVDAIGSFELYSSQNNQYVNDFFVLKDQFVVESVFDEFGYMEVPTVYYSYVAYKDLLTRTKPEHYNFISGLDHSWHDLIERAGPSDPLSNFSRKLVLSDPKDLLRLYSYDVPALGNGYFLEKSANHFLIRLSLESFISIVDIGLLFFLSLLLIISLFVFGIITLSNYSNHEKELFQYFIFGATFKALNAVFYVQKISIGIISFLFSILTTLISLTAINSFLEVMTGIGGIISPKMSTFALFSFLLLLLLIVVVIISIFFPLRFRRRNRANDILRMRT